MPNNDKPKSESSRYNSVVGIENAYKHTNIVHLCQS